MCRKYADELAAAALPFFISRCVQLAILAVHHSMHATHAPREIVDVGSLMSYGPNIPDAWRHAGAYCGRILNGAKPAELPVVQASTFEFVINAQTCRTLSVTVPPIAARSRRRDDRMKREVSEACGVVASFCSYGE
jgi:putative tryptophan/tyrosine transport system substrate-binding protein